MSEPMSIPRKKIPSTDKILLRGGSNPQCCFQQDSRPNRLPMSNCGSKKLTSMMAIQSSCLRTKKGRKHMLVVSGLQTIAHDWDLLLQSCCGSRLSCYGDSRLSCCGDSRLSCCGSRLTYDCGSRLSYCCGSRLS